MVAYSPVIGGSPAAWAYPMPTGTSSAVSTSPATRSLASQERWYSRRVRSPGTHRSGPPSNRTVIGPDATAIIDYGIAIVNIGTVETDQRRLPRTYRSNRRAAQARRTCQRVLDAATAEFLARGYAGATIPAIAAGAAVSVPTVESLFGTKARVL